MNANISKIMMNSSMSDIESMVNLKNSVDAKITSNEVEIRDQLIESKLLSRTLGRGVSPEFIKDFEYLKKRNFDIKKLKKYDMLKSAYNDLKTRPDEYSKFYCEAFEFLDGPKVKSVLAAVGSESLSKEDLQGMSQEGVMSFFAGIGKLGASILGVTKIVSVLLIIAIVLLIIAIIISVVILVKVSRDKNRARDPYAFKDALENEFKYLSVGLIKPCRGILPWVSKVSNSPKVLFSKIKSEELRLKKQSNEFLFTSLIVIAGIGLTIAFVRWAIGFYFNVRVSAIDMLEEAKEVILYRIDEIEKEIDDPSTPKVKRDSLIKIKGNLERELVKLEKRIEKIDDRAKKAVIETTADQQDDIEVVEAEAEQEDDTNSNGPAPVFL